MRTVRILKPLLPKLFLSAAVLLPAAVLLSLAAGNDVPQRVGAAMSSAALQIKLNLVGVLPPAQQSQVIDDALWDYVQSMDGRVQDAIGMQLASGAYEVAREWEGPGAWSLVYSPHGGASGVNTTPCMTLVSQSPSDSVTSTQCLGFDEDNPHVITERHDVSESDLEPGTSVQAFAVMTDDPQVAEWSVLDGNEELRRAEASEPLLVAFTYRQGDPYKQVLGLDSAGRVVYRWPPTLEETLVRHGDFLNLDGPTDVGIAANVWHPDGSRSLILWASDGQQLCLFDVSGDGNQPPFGEFEFSGPFSNRCYGPAGHYPVVDFSTHDLRLPFFVVGGLALDPAVEAVTVTLRREDGSVETVNAPVVESTWSARFPSHRGGDDYYAEPVYRAGSHQGEFTRVLPEPLFSLPAPDH